MRNYARNQKSLIEWTSIKNFENFFPCSQMSREITSWWLEKKVNVNLIFAYRLECFVNKSMKQNTFACPTVSNHHNCTFGFTGHFLNIRHLDSIFFVHSTLHILDLEVYKRGSVLSGRLATTETCATRRIRSSNAAQRCYSSDLLQNVPLKTIQERKESERNGDEIFTSFPPRKTKQLCIIQMTKIH